MQCEHLAMSSKTTVPHSSRSGHEALRERDGLWLMVAGGVLLGTIGIFVEEVHQHPLLTTWFRCAFGALALLVWNAARGNLREFGLHGKNLGLAVATGCLMVLNWAMFFAAIPRTSIAVATVVFHIQPIWVLLFGALFLREPVSRRQWMATPLALLGLTLTTGLLGETSGLHAQSPDYFTGLALCIGGSLSYAAVTLLAKSSQSVAPVTLSFWQCAVGTLMLAWVPWAFGLPRELLSWAWLAGLGVIHTGFAYVVLFAGMARLTLGKIAVLQYVYPLSAVLFDWLIYGTVLSAPQFMGVLLMGGAVWIVRNPNA